MSMRAEGEGKRTRARAFSARRALADAAATEALGRELSLFARPGDWILLFGDLGTGKTTLARAFIRAMMSPAEAAATEVPSPTFTLVQPYEETRVAVAHVDLYRIADPFEVDELGLDELARDHVLLVEWPDRLPGMPPSRLEVHLTETENGRARVANLLGVGDWAARLRRMEEVAAFLKGALGERRVERRFLQGDASARRYERVRTAGEPAMVLMDMPAKADGAALEDGRTYDELVHLARDVRAVAAIDMELLRRGYSAPEIFAHDFERGFLLMEDLGDAVFGRLYARGMMEEPLAAATEVLADMAVKRWPREVTLPDGTSHRLADYDEKALLTEAALLAEWFWPHAKGAPCPREAARSYGGLVRSLLAPLPAVGGRPVWVLRDYHSPNLIWLPERRGVRRVGLIDTQDALFGPAAYDLASLLQDARVDIPPALEARMMKRYCAARAAADATFDESAFRIAYAIMGAQRALKVMGIFARLNMRDGKPHYLTHLPRVAFWLREDLKRLAAAGIEAAGALRAWLEEELPQVATLAARHEHGGEVR